MPIEITENGRMIASPPPYNPRSEAVDDILSRNPGFLSRWALLIFLFIFIGLAAAGWFIQYPDIITSNAKLTSANAPKMIISKIDGKLVELNVRENSEVNKGDIIGFLESTGEHEEIIDLSQKIDTVSALLTTATDKNQLLDKYLNTSYKNLGELQQNYQTFIQALINFRNYISTGFYIKKRAMLEQDMNYLKGLHKDLLLQKKMQEQDIALAQKTFDANESLKKQKVISELEYRNEKSKLLNKKLVLPQINASLTSNESQQFEKQKEILELENTIMQQQAIFQQALNSFKSEIDDWKKMYILTAPVAGKVNFTSFIERDQELKAGEVVCFINQGEGHLFAETYIPQENFGKIKQGAKVLLKFSSYPSQEYGSVRGTVNFVSNVATDSGYLAKIDLPRGLITNYNKAIKYREGLSAKAEIITQSMPLLSRLYYNIRKNVQR